MSEIRARNITPDDWEDWRDIRLRCLLEDPDAFGSTYARESQFDASTWRARTRVASISATEPGTASEAISRCTKGRRAFPRSEPQP